MINKDNKTIKQILSVLGKSKYILLVVLVGVFLILLPTSGSGGKGNAAETKKAAGGEMENFTLYEQEARISKALSEIYGAGDVTVLLTLRSSAEQVIATDKKASVKIPRDGDETSEFTETTVIISSGSQVQNPITLKYKYPEYLGALIVAEGADSPSVRLELMQAVAGLTGLGTDKISVTKMKTS